MLSTDHVMADHYDKRCGGSVYNTACALTSLSGNRPVRVEALTLLGTDEDGDFLLRAMKERGVGCRYVSRTDAHPTQVAFLPVYASGERACIVVPGASRVLDGDALLGEVGVGCKRLDMVRELLWFHLGYPCELPRLHGDGLVEVCRQLKHRSVNVAVSLDLNGASSSLLSFCTVIPHAVCRVRAVISAEDKLAACALVNATKRIASTVWKA